jgi:hypothetical protein
VIIVLRFHLAESRGWSSRKVSVNFEAVSSHFALGDTAQLDHTPKILVQGTRNPRLKTRVVATMDEVGVYGTQGMNFIVPKTPTAPMYYLLGVLNSKLINYLYATKFLNVAIKGDYLKDTPIPKASAAQQRDLTNLVQRILAAKQRNPEADTSALEREIDRLVYRLYDLTQAEIDVVEASTHP